MYVIELFDRSSQKNQLILILYCVALGTLVLTMFILLPVVSKVNMARMNVLSLFVDIPNFHVITLANKCELYMNSFHEEHNDEMESEDEGDAKVKFL
jgi:hypothetical protein